MTANVVPAYKSALLNNLFDTATFRKSSIPNLALVQDPREGFEPARFESGTEVLFIRNPHEFGEPYGSKLAPHWQNGIGLVLFRNVDHQVLGGIFLHGAIKNDWNVIGQGAWQSLGGVMLFSDNAFENKSGEDLIEDVIRKAVAMTLKWQFIDKNLSSSGLSQRTQLGGAKATASHPAGEEARKNAVRILAEVSDRLGIYISGSDQNMTGALCTYFSQLAPKNFMGAGNHPNVNYAGMTDPSPWTALGVFEGIRAARRDLFHDERVPILIQGWGNVGRHVAALAREDQHTISGVIDVDINKLLQARHEKIDSPLFLQIPRQIPLGVLQFAGGITFVSNLQRALDLAPDTVIFSPNAGPKPITAPVAQKLKEKNIYAVIGAANNILATVEGTSEPLAHLLQRWGIFNPCDSETNQMGALSVIARCIDLNETLLKKVAEGVGQRMKENIGAYLHNITPQIARDKAAAQAYNQLVDSDQAIGGRFESSDASSPD